MKDEKTMPKTELATQGSSRGFEGSDNADLIIPRAALVQAQSPAMTAGIPGVKVGSIVNSLTNEILPETFVPLLMYKNWVRFNPRDTRDPNFDDAFKPGSMIWKSNDPTDPRVIAEAKFGPNGELPKATEFMNFLSLFDGNAFPMLVSFSKTSYTAGKQLFSMAKFAGGDMFSRRYKLSSAMVTKYKGSFAVFKVTAAGKVDAATLAQCAKLYSEFSGVKDKIVVAESEEKPWQ